MSSAQAAAEFILVPLSKLKSETVLSFDLYIQHGGMEPVLYRTRDMPFGDEVRVRLQESGVHELLVPESQAIAFEEYCGEVGTADEVLAVEATDPGIPRDETNLVDLLADASVPLEHRCDGLAGVSQAVIALAMEDLSLPGLSDRVRKVAEASARFLLAEPGAYSTLVSRFKLDFEMTAHLYNTSLYTTEFARALGMDDLEGVGRLGRAALVHDVGKGDIPGELLHKEGSLTDLEWAEVMSHPSRGATMLEEAGWHDPICLDVVANHHERCDGSGYPRGLTKEQLSVEARIVAIADTFDSLTTCFPHRPAMSGFQALWRMKRDMAGYFDEKLLDRFIQVMVDPTLHR